MKSGNLNFLEPSGPLQACNGTALPFLFCWIKIRDGKMHGVSNKKLTVLTDFRISNCITSSFLRRTSTSHTQRRDNTVTLFNIQVLLRRTISGINFSSVLNLLHTHSHSHSLTLTHTHSLSHSLTHSHTHIHTDSHSLSH